MKAFRLLLVSALAASFLVTTASAKPGWLTDYKQAQEEAKSKKKLILLDFTGSDWCGYCIKLDREVFSKPEFKEYADKNLVLVEIDFPRGKELTAAQRTQNLELQDKYRIQGYPTFIILDGDGKKLAELGFDAAVPEDATELKGSPQAFIATLEKLRKS